MERLFAWADRLAMPALRVVAAAHLLFLATFLLTLMLAAGQARAQSCGGADLLAELRAGDPAKLRAIEAKAAKTPNGKGILWKIEKPGLASSFLFGTIHMTDRRVTKLGAAAQAAFDLSNMVVIETTDILDQAKMLAQLASAPELMMYTDGSTLTSELSTTDRSVLEQGLQARGIPPESVAKMKPWMLMSLLAMPACEMARKAKGTKILDEKLARDARNDGKALEGLETAMEQMRAMASLPMDFHLRGLIDTLNLGARADDVVETMIVLYGTGETGMYWPLLEETLGGAAGLSDGYSEFEQVMIIERNRLMAERAEPILAKGKAFIAVGALHLPGEQGVVELLRGRGYTITRAD